MIGGDIRVLVSRLNPVCRQALEAAAGLCVTKKHYNIELDHYLAKLIATDHTDIHHILRHYELDPEVILKHLYATLDKLPQGNTSTPVFSQHLLRWLEGAWLTSSLTFQHPIVRSAILLLTLIDDDSLRGLILETCPLLLRISRHSFRQELPELLRVLPESTQETPSAQQAFVHESSPVQHALSALSTYTSDLTGLAEKGKIDPVVGRDKEIRQTLDILCRRRQNNPLLLGDAGVGKTAIIEGLAQRIVNGAVPAALQNSRVMMLDMTALQAGASVKGQFEERLQDLLNAIQASEKRVLLFVDEIHMLMGAGGSLGLGDAANLLKPALARGNLQVIGATTWGDYKHHIEKDPALTRRFEIIKVDEPSEEQAIAILRVLAQSFSHHHGVIITDDAVVAAVRWSWRFMPEQKLPDKAIRLLDTAASRTALTLHSPPAILEETLGKRLLVQAELAIFNHPFTQGAEVTYKENLQARLEDLDTQIEGLQIQWKKTQEEIKQFLAAQKSYYELESTDPQRHLLACRLQQYQQDLSSSSIVGDVGVIVDAQAIAKVLVDWTGIPVTVIRSSGQSWTFDTLTKALEKRLVAQKLACSMIARQLTQSHAGLSDPHKPLGVFLLVGPSGIGKTETAFALAELLTGSSRHLIHVNMNTCQEAHSVATLKGAPPGYVGYGRGGVLTEAVRRNPYAVILLDEVDKAHRDVQELLYQIFDKGHLEDAEGLTANFSNATIIMTANTADSVISSIAHQKPDLENLTDITHPHWQDLMHESLPEISRVFRSAFLSRLTLIPYLPLTPQALAQILEKKLGQLAHRVKAHHGIRLEWEKESLLSIVEDISTSDLHGARAIDACLQHHILPELLKIVQDNTSEKTAQWLLTRERQWVKKMAVAA